jgi:hypothetical protein
MGHTYTPLFLIWFVWGIKTTNQPTNQTITRQHAKPTPPPPFPPPQKNQKPNKQKGTSRGGADIAEIVRRIDLWGLDMVFVVGGNGGNAAANAIQEEIARQDVACVVAGVPKSIDNDILLIDKCFGFDTAVEEAQRALLAAKVEASSGCRGLGIVKLMGRDSGFIAMQARLLCVCCVCVLPCGALFWGGAGLCLWGSVRVCNVMRNTTRKTALAA